MTRSVNLGQSCDFLIRIALFGVILLLLIAKHIDTLWHTTFKNSLDFSEVSFLNLRVISVWVCDLLALMSIQQDLDVFHTGTTVISLLLDDVQVRVY